MKGFHGIALAMAAASFAVVGCGAEDEASDAGVGGEAAGGAAAGGEAAGGAAAGGAAAGGEAAGGAAGGEQPPEEPKATVTWNGDNLVLEITASVGAGPYQLGVAQTGDDMGWLGEDCLEGAFGAVDICHSVPEAGRLELTSVAEVGDVADGKSLFKADMAPTLTYVLIRNSLDFQGCWTWGEDVTYYDDLGCDPLTP